MFLRSEEVVTFYDLDSVSHPPKCYQQNKKMSLYDLTEDQLKEVKDVYGQEVRAQLKERGITGVQLAKEVVNMKKAFFQKETEENRKWLVDHGYIKNSEPAALQEDGTIQIPKDVFLKLVQKLQDAEKMIKELREELNSFRESAREEESFADKIERAHEIYLKQAINQYILGGCNNKEAKAEAENDWEGFSQEDKLKYLQ